LLPGFEIPVKGDEQGDATQPSEKMEHAVQAGDEFHNGFPDGFLWPAANPPRSQGNRPFSWRTGVADLPAPSGFVSMIVRRDA
jgi:hypothetical protein